MNVLFFWVIGWLVTMVVYGSSVHTWMLDLWRRLEQQGEDMRPYTRLDGWFVTLMFWPIFMTVFAMYGSKD